MKILLIALLLTLTVAAHPATAQVSSSKTQTILVGHTVTLNWTASTSTIDHYNIYVSVTSGSNYVRLGSATATTFVDLTAIAGRNYFYVATAVDSGGNESVNSNEVSVVIPSP